MEEPHLQMVIILIMSLNNNYIIHSNKKILIQENVQHIHYKMKIRNRLNHLKKANKFISKNYKKKLKQV